MMLLAVCSLVMLAFSPIHGQTKNVVELAEELGLTTLVQQIKEKNLEGALTAAGPFTIMAPTNDAFSAVPADVLSNATAVAEILQFHVVASRVASTDLTNELEADSLLAGSKIRFNIYGDDPKVITSMGAVVTNPDQQASNGIIHVIDKVMLPARYDIVGLVIATGDLSSLLGAVQSTNLAAALQENSLTVFAPNNAAFTAAGAVSNLTALAEILKYHVIPQTLYSAGISGDGQTIATLEGGSLVFTVKGDEVYVNNAKVLSANFGTSNGVAHVIDKVIMPPSGTVVDLVKATSTFTQLLAAVLAADLATTLSGTGPFTVFAPNDAAFAKVDDLASILANKTLIASILKYHVVSGRAYSVSLMNDQKLDTLEKDKSIKVEIKEGVVTLNPGKDNAATVIGVDNTVTNGVVHIIDTVLLPGDSPPVSGARAVTATGLLVMTVTLVINLF